MAYLDFINPGGHLHKRKLFVAGDILNLTACISLILVCYFLYRGLYSFSLYLILFVVGLMVINFWQLWNFKKQLLNPANMEFQEKKFREILVNFLLGNENESITALQNLVNSPHNSNDMEIFLAILLQRNNKQKKAQEIMKELKKNKLSTASESLLFSIEKQF